MNRRASAKKVEREMGIDRSTVTALVSRAGVYKLGPGYNLVYHCPVVRCSRIHNYDDRFSPLSGSESFSNPLSWTSVCEGLDGVCKVPVGCG